MRPIRDTIPIAEALALAMGASIPLDRTERLPLEDSVGRVLAVPVVADRDVPPFNRAAMDGYAVIADSTFGASRMDPHLLACVETVHTGGVPSKTLVTGQCTQIATGAPMPDGADAVVMVEETDRRDGGQVAIFTPVYPRQHVGRRGADITNGARLLQPGDHLTPSRVGSIAALGIANIEVYAKPRVAILSTGNEIIAPGQPLGPGQIYDINRFTLGSVIREHGGVAVPLPTAPDNLEDLSDTVDACLEHDLLVFSGGSSVGERDLTVDVIRRKGEILFHGIAVKPGKPTVFGTIGTTPVLGMPGYPTSCLSNAYMLLMPHGLCPGCTTDRLDYRAPSVLYGASRGWHGGVCVQGLRRHHQHVAGGWIHRDPGPDRHCGGRRDRRSEVLLTSGAAGVRTGPGRV
jgi:molybdenum cofactor synthesis domain-containing protein